MNHFRTPSEYDVDDEIVADLCRDGALAASSDNGSVFVDTPAALSEDIEDAEFSQITLEIPESDEFIHIDQMEQMWRTCVEKGRKTVFQNLYSLLCALAMDAVSTQYDKMDSSELYLVIFEQCEQAFNNLHLSTQAQSIIFNHLPKGNHPSLWPDEFVEWWNTKVQTPVSNTMLNRDLKKFKNRSADTQKMAYFGYKAKEQFTTDRNYIRSHLCTKWIPPHRIPSGKTVHGVLHAIRMSCIPLLAHIRAKTATNNDLKKLPVEADRTTVKAAIYERRKQEALVKLEETKSSFYPDCWLTFIYCSLPSPKPMLNFIPSHGLSTNNFQHGTDSGTPGTAFRNMLSRDRRRALRKVNDGSTSDEVLPCAKKAAVELVENDTFEKIILVHEVKELSRTPVDELQSLIETKQLELSLQQMLGKEPQELTVLIQELITLVRQKGEMHRAFCSNTD